MTDATKQAKAGKGGIIPPKDKQFGQPNGNPRHNGAWKKEDSARYKLEQMLKLTEAELLEIVNDKDAPYFERKLARCINKGNWQEIQGMLNQVYGMPKQINENKNIEIKPILPMKEKK